MTPLHISCALFSGTAALRISDVCEGLDLDIHGKFRSLKTFLSSGFGLGAFLFASGFGRIQELQAISPSASA